MSKSGDEWGPESLSPSWRGLVWFDRALGWLKYHERVVLIAAVAFHVLFLAGMILVRAAPLQKGRTILLRVVPVDPRDLLRGDYVTLSYEISPLSTTLNDPAVNLGRTVYVTLAPEGDGRHYRRAGISLERPPSGVTFIKGTTIDRGRIRYGIESYFVQEGKGKEYETAIRNHCVSAEVALTADGEAAPRGLIIE
jgi:uncharacterized membrane-anchored protein